MADNEDGYDGKGAGPYWQEQLEFAKTVFEKWVTAGEKVIRRYRDERSMADTASKFNILWSNVQVLTPSLYGRPAKPQVSRRYQDADPIGRLASTMLERVLEYEVDQFPDFDAAMKGVVEDRLLPGRGTAWIRYEPVISSESPAEGVEPVETVDQAHSPVDYVYWKDFLHSPARTWDEVWWVARCTYMTKTEGVGRFGSSFNAVTLSEYEEDSNKDKKESSATYSKKAKVFEIWNKNAKRVCWIAEGYGPTLDEVDDPLKLEGFFPCPKPLFATTTTGSLIPVPDYREYQDQSTELDDLTGRIDKMVAAVKANGVYNAEFKEIGRLLNTRTDNTLIPVGQWGTLAEKGGLAGAVEMLDLTTVLQALGALYTARESVKVTIYEICGISDIMRSQTKAEETLGAQQLKVNFGSLRLRSSQVDVARFASDVFKLKAQVICQQYPPPLIVEMSGVMQTVAGQDQNAIAQALQLLRNSTVRDFHISVQSDSLAQIDEAEEKKEAAEFLAAVSGFVQQALPMVQSAPETLPMAEALLMFTVRKFKGGRETEAAIEQTMKLLQQKAMAAAQNPPPTEAEMEAKAKAQEAQLRAQVDAQSAQQKGQIDFAVQSAKLEKEKELELAKHQMEERMAAVENEYKAAIEKQKDETERFKATLQSQTQLAIAEMGAKAQAESAQKTADANVESTKIKTGQVRNEKLDETYETVQGLLATVTELQNRPRRRSQTVVRDANDRIIAVDDVYEDRPN